MGSEGREYDFDFLIVGSGFGGSVSAMRLAQKGYRIALVEQGKRWYPADFPRTNRNIFKFIWSPRLWMRGFCRIKSFRHLLAAGGVGVGGGSLVFGGSLQKPGDEFFQNERMHAFGGENALSEYYRIASGMLGAKTNPRTGVEDIFLRKTAAEMGSEFSFRSCDAGIFFGEEGKTADDPYFFSEGAKRKGCNFCGACMTGCRHNAKNSLDKNYLYFAEKIGITLIPETKVVRISPLEESGQTGYAVYTENSLSFMKKNPAAYAVKSVILSAGTRGTLELLFKMKQKGDLKNISDALGTRVLTNNNTFMSVRMPSAEDIDFSNGIAFSSQVSPEPDTKIEALKWGRGSDLMGLLFTVYTEIEGFFPLRLRFIASALLHPFRMLRTFFPFRFALNNFLLMSMGSADTHLSFRYKRFFLFPFAKRLVSVRPRGAGSVSGRLSVLKEFSVRLARRTGGEARSSLTEVLFRSPTVIHLMGGVPAGDSPDDSVIDGNHRVHGYKNLFVCDASVIPANPGVNPSLTITALAERFMSKIPANYAGRMRIFQIDKKLKAEKHIKGKPQKRTSAK